MRHVVLQAVDAESVPTPDLIWLDLRAGDRLLLCSDGLSDLVPDAEILRLLAVDSRRLAATGLIQRRARRAAVATTSPASSPTWSTPSPSSAQGLLVGAARDMTNVVDPAHVRPVRSA